MKIITKKLLLLSTLLCTWPTHAMLRRGARPAARSMEAVEEALFAVRIKPRNPRNQARSAFAVIKEEASMATKGAGRSSSSKGLQPAKGVAQAAARETAKTSAAAEIAAWSKTNPMKVVGLSTALGGTATGITAYLCKEQLKELSFEQFKKHHEIIHKLIKYNETARLLLASYVSRNWNIIPVEIVREFVDVEHEYTINLMWVNQKLNADQRYIFPADNDNELKSKFLDVIFMWASKCSDGEIVVWFDSAHITEDALARTRELVEKHNQDSQKGTAAHITLKDVRKLSLVKQHPEIFSKKLPVYFRVDLLRLIAAQETVGAGKDHYFVYADLDMEPISRVQLFDKETSDNLKHYGFVAARLGMFSVENGFFIVSNDSSHILEAMRYPLIEYNIQKGYSALEHDSKSARLLLSEEVFFSYFLMFMYFWHLKGYAKLWVTSYNPFHEEEYKKDIHGIDPFKHCRNCGNNRYLQLKFVNKEEKLPKTGTVRRGKIVPIPTKEVPIPSSNTSFFSISLD